MAILRLLSGAALATLAFSGIAYGVASAFDGRAYAPVQVWLEGEPWLGDDGLVTFDGAVYRVFLKQDRSRPVETGTYRRIDEHTARLVSVEGRRRDVHACLVDNVVEIGGVSYRRPLEFRCWDY